MQGRKPSAGGSPKASPSSRHTSTPATTRRGRSAETKASRLVSNGKIASRVAELQAKAAEKTGITIKSLTDDLIRLRMLAEANAQVAAGVAAVGMIAKLHGLVIDKAQVEAIVRRPAPAPGIEAGVILSEEDWQQRLLAKHTGMAQG